MPGKFGSFAAMKKYAVIVAGGSGARMGSSVPKQFLLLRGKPVLWHTLTVFLAAYDDLELILVLPAAHLEAGRELAGSLSGGARVRVTAGGPTRWHSVSKGLELVEEDALVAVHDGVRCLVSVELIRRCFGQAERLGSAIPTVGCKDSVRVIRGEGSEAVDRDLVRLVQTPQVFRAPILLQAFRAGYRESFTDETMVVEASGAAVHLAEGDPSNIKITTPLDLILAEKILEMGGTAASSVGNG